MDTKICFKCGTPKELAEFYKHSRMADGHLNKCIECTKKDVRRHRDTNLDAVQAYDRERGKLPHRLKANRDRQRVNPEPHKKALIRWTEKHPERKKAANAVSNAVRDGRLTKKPCEVCGATKVEAHHDDYTKPLEVRWLCNSHHKAADKERQAYDSQHRSTSLDGALARLWL